jgi:hypothetical protein
MEVSLCRHMFKQLHSNETKFNAVLRPWSQWFVSLGNCMRSPWWVNPGSVSLFCFKNVLLAKSREYLQINDFTTEFLCVLYLPRTCVFAISRDYEPKRTVLGSAGYVLCDAPELLKNAQAMTSKMQRGGSQGPVAPSANFKRKSSW